MHSAVLHEHESNSVSSEVLTFFIEHVYRYGALDLKPRPNGRIQNLLHAIPDFYFGTVWAGGHTLHQGVSRITFMKETLISQPTYHPYFLEETKHRYSKSHSNWHLIWYNFANSLENAHDGLQLL